jgi:hypothetical protein
MKSLRLGWENAVTLLPCVRFGRAGGSGNQWIEAEMPMVERWVLNWVPELTRRPPAQQPNWFVLAGRR